MAFCMQCGAQVGEGYAFCTQCGAPVAGSAPAQGQTTVAMPQANPQIPQGQTAVNAPITTPTGTIYQTQPTSAPAPNPYQQTAAMPKAQQAPYAGGQQQPYGYADPTTPMPYGAPAPAGNYGNAYGSAPVPPKQNGINQRTIIIACAAIAAIAIIAIVVVLFVKPGGAKTCTVTFETSGGVQIAPQTVQAGSSIQAPPNPTKAGYMFGGWSTDPQGSQVITFPYKVEKDTTLYAKWEDKPTAGETAATTTGSSGASSTGSSNTNAQNNQGGSATQSSGSTVSISITGADGTTRRADIHRKGSTERVLPEGSTRRLTASDISGLSDAERCIAWNEIIAASNGYKFKNSGLASYFSKCSWYHPDPNASGSGNLNADQSANVDLLKSYTDSWWLTLATY